jgi:hypothetical protein
VDVEPVLLLTDAALGHRQDASFEVRPTGRAETVWRSDANTGEGGFLPRTGRTLLAAARADGGTTPQISAAEVEQEPLALQSGAFSVHRAQVNQLLSPALHRELGDLTSSQIAV